MLTYRINKLIHAAIINIKSNKTNQIVGPEP